MRTLFLAAFLLPAIALTAQDTKYLVLQDRPIAYTPKYFSIAGISDLRGDTSMIGRVNAAEAGKQDPLVLESGLSTALMQYFGRNLTQDKSKMPVELQVNEFYIMERKDGPTRKIILEEALAISVKGQQLVSYKGEGYQETGKNVYAYLHVLINQGLENALKEFDSWIEKNQQELNAMLTAPVVDVQVQKSTADLNKLAFDPQRSLQKDDFMGEADKASKLPAYSSVGVAVNPVWEGTDEKPLLTVRILPYFDKTASWSKKKNPGKEILQHEQGKLLIARVLACEMAAMIRANGALRKGNFKQEIEKLRVAVSNQLQKLIQDYDQQTEQGSRKEEQADWEKRLNDRLAREACDK